MKRNFSKSTDLKSESISKRDQDLNEILENNFEKLVDLKLKGISDDKVSNVYYSTKPETSSPYSKPASEEEDDDKSIVRFTHPSLETVVITCQDKKTEVNATPFKIEIGRASCRERVLMPV